jgi:AraC-like DNA-binding protein
MSIGSVNFAAIRFSTRDLPERKRLPMWRAEFARSLLRVDIEPLSDLPFEAEATLRELPGLRTLACTGSAARFRRTRAMAADGDDSISLIVNLDKSCAASQRGRNAETGAGDGIAVLNDVPAEVTHAQGSYFSLFVPRAALASRLKHVEDATLRPIPRDTEPLRLLMSYMRTVQDELVLATPKLRRLVVTHVHDLVALALNPAHAVGESCLRAVAAARLSAALNHIAKCFQDPELSVAAVARSQRISPRYLQRLLEASGTSFTARVTELRLQRASALLSEPGTRRIADIALDAGFSDISHFNRLFRVRFGDTPSAIRAQGLNKAFGGGCAA